MRGGYIDNSNILRFRKRFGLTLQIDGQRHALITWKTGKFALITLSKIF